MREQVLEHLFVGNNMAREIKVANELICKLKPVKKTSGSNLVSTYSSDHSNVLIASGGHTEVNVFFHEKTLVSRSNFMLSTGFHDQDDQHNSRSNNVIRFYSRSIVCIRILNSSDGHIKIQVLQT